jgi:CBS domain-containing protein
MAGGLRARSLADMDNALTSVADVMRAGVLSVSETTSLAAVAHVMQAHGVHGVLVAGDDGAPRGWITARGLLRRHAADWRRLAAGDAIDEPCVAVVPSASVTAAIETLLGSDATHLAVVRPGSRTPDGVVSDVDLVAHLSR